MKVHTRSNGPRIECQHGEGVVGEAGPLLKLEQAANYLAISTRQLQYLSQGGELAVIRIGKSGVRYDRADLDEFVASHRSVGRGVGREVACG